MRMGNVSVKLKVFPEDPGKVEELKASIVKAVSPRGIEIEDIGFGVKLIKVMVVVPDTDGGKVEEAIKALPGISEVQVEEVTLV